MFFIFGTEIISWLVLLLVVVFAIYLLLFTPVGIFVLLAAALWWVFSLNKHSE